LSSNYVKSLLESPRFPISVVNDAAAREKQGGGRPEYWEMVFWWTRKPLISARAVILGALVPENVNVGKFAGWIRLRSDKTPHRENPELPPEIRERLRSVKLLDPFAGFGSIPLEAVRLGIGEVVAVELLPTAYVFLKAVLEHPKNYGSIKVGVSGEEIERLGLESATRKFSGAKRIEKGRAYEIPALIYDVARWGSWIAERLKIDPDIRGLYDEDIAVYIGTWEVKCPVCGRYTPLVGNWWLARVKGKAYAYMRPKVVNGGVEIEVVKSSEGAPEPNISGRPEKARCLLCGSEITYVDPETGRVIDRKRKSAEFYPKLAIRDWNQKLEQYLSGQIDLQTLRNTARARPRLLVKVKVVERDLEFEPAIQEDNEKLWKALEKLRQIWGDPDIPTELIPDYERRQLMVCTSTGACKWFKLFNPRQLLTLVRLVKLIREAGKRVEEEKLREGWSKEEAFRYAEAVTTYLAIALARYVTFNSVVAPIRADTIMGAIVAGSLTFRGIAMVWNYGEIGPFADITGSLVRNIRSVCSGLSYLVSAVSGSPSRVRVLLDDATVLSKLGGEKFDLIVTDPPYRDDVAYSELSDFYYVWLKRALSDDGLAPRFYPEAFVYNTQWESFAAREVSYNEGRAEFFGVEAEDHYRRLLRYSFAKMVEHLKNGGIIVTYYTHSSPDAWRDLVDAAKYSNLVPTVAWLVVTESEERVTARGKTALEASIVIAWRRADGKPRGEYDQVFTEAIKAAEDAVKELQSRHSWTDIFIAAMVRALSTFMSYAKVLRYGKELAIEDIVRESYAIATRIISGATQNIRSPEMLLYLAAKRMFKTKKGTYLSSQDLITLSYGLSPEGWRRFVNNTVVKPVSGSSKTKDYVLIEPHGTGIEELKRVLDDHGISAVHLSAKGRELTSVDILHLLEYFARQGCTAFIPVYRELYARNQQLVREAVEATRVILRQFKYSGDPESELAENVLACIGG